MARIRTIKPDFFTSEDIVSLSPSARLLYIALWCEADREGRMAWRPATFKLRYFPGDKGSIDALCGELTGRGLVVKYGEGLAYIPTFLEHQHPNPREQQSSLPEPPKICTRDDASNPDLHAQVGRAGKGKEGEKREGEGREGNTRHDASRSHGSRLPPDWQPSEILKAWTTKERPDIDAEQVAAKFRDYWRAVPGSRGCKLDWDATFRNFVRTEKPGAKGSGEVDINKLIREIEEDDKKRAAH
jgi:hypothetical protein